MTRVDLEYLHVFVDRHGHVRCYFRYRGQRWPLPLPHDPGFATAYEARMNMIKEGSIPVIGNVTFIPGSLGWAIDQFLASDEYRTKAKNTKKYARRILDLVKMKYGAGMLRDLTPKHVKRSGTT